MALCRKTIWFLYAQEQVISKYLPLRFEKWFSLTDNDTMKTIFNNFFKELFLLMSKVTSRGSSTLAKGFVLVKRSKIENVEPFSEIVRKEKFHIAKKFILIFTPSESYFIGIY